MEKKELKKYNIVQDIWSELFGYYGTHKADFDVSYGDEQILNLTETSGDFDFKVTTQQTRSENVYFQVNLYDYRKKQDIYAGFFYIKNYTGLIGSEELKALNLIMQAGNERTQQIFELIG